MDDNDDDGAIIKSRDAASSGGFLRVSTPTKVRNLRYNIIRAIATIQMSFQ